MASFSTNKFNPEYKEGENETNIRTIGLEIEGSVKRDEDHPFGDMIYEEDYYDDDNDEDEYDSSENRILAAHQEFIPEVGGLGFDGDGVEFALQPASINLYKDGGSKNFKKVMKFLKENLEPQLSTNSGTHINISLYENEDKERTFDNTYWLIANFAIQLQKIAGRVSHWAKIMPYTGEKQTSILLEKLQYNREKILIKTTKPATVKEPSLDSYFKNNAIINKSDKLIEFRLFKTTNQIKEAIAWIELCYNIIEAAAHDDLNLVKFKDLIQGEYIKKYVLGLKGQRKLTPEEMSATVETQFELKMLSAGAQTIIL